MKQSSLLSWKEAMEGTSAPLKMREALDLITVDHYGYDGESLQ